MSVVTPPRSVLADFEPVEDEVQACVGARVDGRPCRSDGRHRMAEGVYVCWRHRRQIEDGVLAHFNRLSELIGEQLARLHKDQRTLENRRQRVYFLAADGLIKIGYSAYPPTRVNDLQPDGVLLLLRGGRSLERGLHKRFAPARAVDEWFYPSGDLLAFIARAEHLFLADSDLRALLNRGLHGVGEAA